MLRTPKDLVLRRRASKSSFGEGTCFIRSRSKQGMLRAWIRNPRNPPKDVVLLRRASSGSKEEKQSCMKRICIQLRGKWLSGSRRQTVNLLAFVIAGSNPAFPKRCAMRQTPKDLLLLHSLRRCGARNASHSEGCGPSSLRRIWSFEEGPRSGDAEQEMLCARIRNPRNPPKDVILRRGASKSDCGDLRRTLLQNGSSKVLFSKKSSSEDILDICKAKNACAWLDNIMVMYWIANPVMTVQVRL